MWELTKWLATIAAGITAAVAMIENFPMGENVPHASEDRIIMGALFASVIVGGITLGFLSALESVYRGFRPLPDTMAGVPTNPDQEATVATQAPRPALPHPESQQKSVERL